jgi:hypothetical protein
MAIRIYTGSGRPIDSRFENDLGHEKVEVDATDGSVDRGYREIATGKLLCLATMVVSAARASALAAQQSAADSATTKTAAAKTVVLNQVLRVKAIAPGSRTDQDRWLLALSWLLFQQD